MIQFTCDKTGNYYLFASRDIMLQSVKITYNTWRVITRNGKVYIAPKMEDEILIGRYEVPTIYTSPEHL